MLRSVLTALLILPAVVPLRAAAVLLVAQPSVTFYEDGSAPVATETAQAGETFTVSFVGTTATAIDTAYVQNDTLVIETYPDSLVYIMNGGASILPPSYGAVMTFMRAGMLTVCELPERGVLTSVAEFRVLPLVATAPALPVTGTPVRMDLVMGYSHTACNPSYAGLRAVVGDSTVTLGWTEVPFSGVCPGAYYEPPLSYGPSFDLGTMAAGTYTIIIEDTVAAGTFTVGDPVHAGGVVYRMQHPFIDMLDQPVAGVQVVAETYFASALFDPPEYDGPVCTTYTDSLGGYSLVLPRADFEYTFRAAAEGYHDQSVVYDPALPESHMFQLLPEKDDTTVPVRIAVQDDGGAPLESVYVSIYGGRKPALWTVYESVTAVASMFGDKTGADGIVRFDSVSLVPYIDYVYEVQRYGTDSFTQDGTFRLYQASGYDNDIIITVGTSGTRTADPVDGDRFAMTMPDNPVCGNALIVRYAAGTPVSFTLFGPSGNAVRSVGGVRTGMVGIPTTGLQPGVYLLRARSGNREEIRRVLVR